MTTSDYDDDVLESVIRHFKELLKQDIPQEKKKHYKIWIRVLYKVWRMERD